MTLLDNKQCHQVRKGFIAFLLDDIACQQAMTSCKKGVYRFLTWWHCLSTFLVDSELILHNKSACQHGMLILKKEHKSCIAQFYGLWAKLDCHFFSVLQPKKIRFFTSPKNSTVSDLEELNRNRGGVYEEGHRQGVVPWSVFGDLDNTSIVNNKSYLGLFFESSNIKLW